jgi:predicted phosphodiesterase
MARIGILADLHGNAVALDAVLAALAADRVDRLVCLGDVVAGPQPRAVLARLREVDCPSVMGNADAEVLTPPPSASDEDARRAAEIAGWCAARLSPADLNTLRGFPPTLEIPLGDGATLLCCHGSPRSFDEAIRPTTPDDDLDAMLADVAALVVAAGHTHVQSVRRHRDKLLVNPGSVGLPFDPLPPAAPVRNPPWAEYAVLTAAAGALSVDLRRVPFDAERFVRETLASGMPHAAWYTADWARRPSPSDPPAMPRPA